MRKVSKYNVSEEEMISIHLKSKIRSKGSGMTIAGGWYKRIPIDMRKKIGILKMKRMIH